MMWSITEIGTSMIDGLGIMWSIVGSDVTAMMWSITEIGTSESEEDCLNGLLESLAVPSLVSKPSLSDC